MERPDRAGSCRLWMHRPREHFAGDIVIVVNRIPEMGVSEAPQAKRQFSIEEAYAHGDPYPHYAWFREHDPVHQGEPGWPIGQPGFFLFRHADVKQWLRCLLYTSDAADDLLCVDLGGRRI